MVRHKGLAISFCPYQLLLPEASMACGDLNTGLFKMIVGVHLSSGNSAPNSGNNHHLTIPFVGGIRDRVRVYPGTECTNQNRH